MNAVDLIARKQAGRELSSEDIAHLIEDYTYSKIPDYQIAALLMAIYFQGMSHRETVDLVRTMVASGKRADHSALPARKVDKHSTGGVGDKLSLLVAPIVASLGVPVPMISGRGLGHTGGTLDKLESIPGFTTRLSLEQFERQVAEIGCALIGQSDEIVPADQKMYALRDVTATVRSVPLIVGSILSKKIAEGIDALLLDVKFGKGAVFEDLSGARRLAQNLVAIGKESGLEVQALLTDMNQPLGRAVGNWLEVKECLEILTGKADPGDLLDLTLAEAALMLMLGQVEEDYTTAHQKARKAIESGAAYRKFLEIARHQKADVSYLENPEKYQQSTHRVLLESRTSGYIQEIDALQIGLAAVDLGAGRRHKEHGVDYTAGIYLHVKKGDRVEKGAPLAELYSSTREIDDQLKEAVYRAYQIADAPVNPHPLIVSHLSRLGEKPWTV